LKARPFGRFSASGRSVEKVEAGSTFAERLAESPSVPVQRPRPYAATVFFAQKLDLAVAVVGLARELGAEAVGPAVVYAGEVAVDALFPDRDRAVRFVFAAGRLGAVSAIVDEARE